MKATPGNSTYFSLFLWFKNSIDKFCNLAVEMFTSRVIINLELDIIKKFLANPYPNVE